ncbi:MAG: hypothetical protein RM022_031055 [Nostoc sp. EfeVER01]|uniref:hypothetical protein n=1 Tax=unclassified Nostoc TaxID=2593658 RepID=UPI002AD4A9B7|nr:MULTISPECIES: hypothetical protein [unclassified Nostoc]MDZ7943840.1 hypothetical protein [Nostoc sp. EfeVER01]MDZ7992029.1 hypothetical protein [Nostoc sp. EspVER01]
MGFRDLQRYESQKSRYDKYKAWLAMTPDQRQAAYAAITDETKRARAEKEDGYISPFGTAGTTKIYLSAQLIKSGQTGQGSGVANVLLGLLASRTTTATEFGALTTPIKIDAKRFKFAKLTLTSVVPGTTKKNSRITGAAYKKPDVDSVTSPFGQGTGGEAYDAAVAAIEQTTEYVTFIEGNGGKNRARFTPEG